MKEKVEDELNQISPFFSEMRKGKSGMTVPPDYFNNIEHAVMGQIKSKGLTRPQPAFSARKGGQWKRFALVAAALFVAVLGAFRLFQNHAQTQNQAFAELTETDIETYVIDNVQDFEVTQLATLTEVEMTQKNDIEPTQNQKESTLDDIRPEDVEQILDDMSEEELEEIL